MVRNKSNPNRSMSRRSQSSRNSIQESSVISQRERSQVKKRKPQKVKYVMGGQVLTATKSLFKEMRRLQNTTDHLIPRLPFSRLVREVLMKYAPNSMRVQVEALRALQEASEIYLTQLFSDANRCARHAHRVTLKVIDINLVLDLRGSNDPGTI